MDVLTFHSVQYAFGYCALPRGAAYALEQTTAKYGEAYERLAN